MTVAANSIHNSNGIGRGHNDDEILICKAAVGALVPTKPEPELELSQSSRSWD